MFHEGSIRERNPGQFTVGIVQVAAGLALLVGLLEGPAPDRAAPIAQDGGEGQTIFQAKCAACHTIGQGKLAGPDLKDVASRRDPAWLRSFIANPEAQFAANDPTAQQLLAEFNGVKMPAAGLSDAELDAVLAYLAGPSPAARATPAAQQPQPAGDPAAGRLLFTGELAPRAGGPACIGCHNVAALERWAAARSGRT